MASYGRAVRESRKTRRFQNPVRQSCTVLPTPLGGGRQKSQFLFWSFAMSNIITTPSPVVTFAAEIGGEIVQACDARALHAFLQSKRDFPTWFASRVKQGGFVEGEDFSPNQGKSTGGRPAVDYTLTLDMAKHLGMMERNDQGKAIRDYFIAIERAARAANLELPLFVSPAQQRQLQDAIAARFPDGKQRPYAWGRFNAHFKLGSYKQLPSDQIDEALAYIAQMPDSTGNPPPSEVETMAMERLRHARFVMYWDDKGRMMLREIPIGARVMSDEQIAGMLSDPGSMVDKKLLPGIIEAAAKRLAP